MIEPIRPTTKADNFSVDYRQAIVDHVNATASLRSTGPVDVLATPAGQTIIDRSNLVVTDLVYGVVTDTGPAGTEDDFDDARHWVRVQRTIKTDPDAVGPRVDIEDEDTPADDIGTSAAHADVVQKIVVATDVFSDPDAHAFSVDDVVLLMGVYATDGSYREKCWVIIGPGGGLTVMKDGDPATKTKVSILNLPDDGTSDIVEIVPDTDTDGNPIHSFRIQAPPEELMGIFYIAGRWQFSFTLAH